MKTYHTRLWVSNLESIYNQAQTAKSIKPFFLAIYDYVQYILMTDGLNQLSDTLNVQKEAEQEEGESHRLKRVKETRAWYTWDKLRLFFTIYSDIEAILTTDTNFPGLFDISEDLPLIKKELEAIQNDSANEEFKTFNHNDYLNYLHKVHRQLLNEIHLFEKSIDFESETKPQNHTYSLNYETAIFSINGKQCKFKKDTLKLAFLEKLIENPEGVYYSEIAEELEGVVVNRNVEEIKTRYYNICRGLQGSFAKIGILDFLEYDGNQAKILPPYKKAK